MERLVKDGERVRRGDVLMTVTGRTRDLLVAERTALNLLCHLSGVATATRAWVDALEGTGAAVRDTRKTTPGLRALEKYAVRCGGGVNHRLVAVGRGADQGQPRRRRRRAWSRPTGPSGPRFPDVPVEVEVDSLDQLDEVLAEGADLVLLDNFTPEQMREAVRRAGGPGAVWRPAAG